MLVMPLGLALIGCATDPGGGNRGIFDIASGNGRFAAVGAWDGKMAYFSSQE
jgi:hypothetical protein